MKESLAAQKEIEQALINAGIDLQISGAISCNSRKLGSTKEDVVISTLYWGGDQIQEGIINVNIHVPNLAGLKGKNPTAVDKTQPNIERFQSISTLITEALQGYSGQDFLLHFNQPGKLDGYGTEWLYNMRVEYIHLQKDY